MEIEINKIDKSIRKKITDDWLNYFTEFSSKGMRLFKIVGPFVLELELIIERGNIRYEPCLQLIPLTSEYFSLSGASIFYQKFRDNSGKWLDIDFAAARLIGAVCDPLSIGRNLRVALVGR